LDRENPYLEGFFEARMVEKNATLCLKEFKVGRLSGNRKEFAGLWSAAGAKCSQRCWLEDASAQGMQKESLPKRQDSANVDRNA
jgi:hypothetical protein